MKKSMPRGTFPEGFFPRDIAMTLNFPLQADYKRVLIQASHFLSHIALVTIAYLRTLHADMVRTHKRYNLQAACLRSPDDVAGFPRGKILKHAYRVTSNDHNLFLIKDQNDTDVMLPRNYGVEMFYGIKCRFVVFMSLCKVPADETRRSLLHP